MTFQARVTTPQENLFDGWFDEQVVKIHQKVGKQPFSNEDLIFIILNQQKHSFDALGRQTKEGFARSDRELKALREDMQKGFERSDNELKIFREEIKIFREEIKTLREDMQKGFEKSDNELKTLREDMQKGFERSDNELKTLREDMQKGFETVHQDMKDLRKDMNDLTIRMFTSILAAVGVMFALLRFFPPTV